MTHEPTASHLNGVGALRTRKCRGKKGGHRAGVRIQYFDLVYEQNPKWGRRNLVRAARALAAADGAELNKRDEITDDRAKRYLKRMRRR